MPERASPVSSRGPLGVLVQVVAALIVTVLLLAAIEFGAGLLVGNENELQRAEGDYVATTLKVLELAPDLNPAPLVADTQLLWRNKPNARKTQPVNPQAWGRRADWTIENNSRGYRGPELKHPVEERGVYRVLCVGDSITYGFNVDQEAPYARRLERLLQGRSARPVEVINAGVPGWSWVQGRRFLEVEGMGLHPDVVVIGHGTNDQFFPTQVTDRESMERLARPVARGMGALVPYLLHTNTYRAILRHVRPLREQLTFSPGCKEQKSKGGNCHRVSIDEIAESVRAIRGLTAAAGIDLLVLNVDFMETAAVQGSRRAADEQHVPFLDFMQRFNDLRRGDEQTRAARLHLAPSRTAGAPPSPAAVNAVLRVLAPEGSSEMSAKGTAYFVGNYEFDERMYDDGTHGDEIAGDRVFSTTLVVPAGVFALDYKYYRGADAEFVVPPPRPPATGYRLLRLAGDTIGPVEVFAEILLMAERTHPDARGQAEIAQGVAAHIDALPSFGKFRTTPEAAR
jgi:lysophospholipase L1-like esterase